LDQSNIFPNIYGNRHALAEVSATRYPTELRCSVLRVPFLIGRNTGSIFWEFDVFGIALQLESQPLPRFLPPRQHATE
jgi:hypothetical protein